jgi:pyruvate ferredoxin oxidoreductase beta subunit
VAIDGDGAIFDIGFGSLAGMLERGDDVLYTCADNDANMNAGDQRSGTTPFCEATTTHPAVKALLGKTKRKKDLPEMVATHGVPYVATASVAHIGDLKQKMKKAMTLPSPRDLQIDTPCLSVWNFLSRLKLDMGRFGVNCGIVPLFEMEKITKLYTAS